MKQRKIRPFEQDDLSYMQDWLYKPHISPWFEHPHNWIKEIENRAAKFQFINHYIVIYDDIPIGFCQYYLCAMMGEFWGSIPSDGTYSLDYLIGDERYLGMGIGKEIAGNLVEMIKARPDSKRIVVHPEKNNLRSRGVLIANDFYYDDVHEIFILEL